MSTDRSNPPATFTIGALARATGVSVRTLHHYHSLGLLSPSRRTASNYRVYGRAELERLHRIVALRQLGFSLQEIASLMAGRSMSLRKIIDLRLQRLSQELATLRRAQEQLQSLAVRLDAGEVVSVDALLRSIEGMTMINKYYTEEQLEQLKARREQLGEAEIQRVQNRWPALIAEARAAMNAGLSPTDPKVIAIATEWKSLIQMFTGGDPGISQSLKNLYANEKDLHTKIEGVPDPALMAWLAPAMKG